MLLSILLVGLVLQDVSVNRLAVPGVYGYIYQNQVAKSLNHFYIVNSGESQVNVVGFDGHIERTIGSKGEGPGEFSLPIDLQIVNGSLFVYDLGRREVNEFDLDGTFRKRSRDASYRGYTQVGKGGIIRYDFKKGVEAEGSLQAYDFSFKNPRSLLTWTNTWLSPSIVQKPVYPAVVNPCREWVFFCVTDDGGLGYLVHSGPKLVVSVFDLAGMKHLATHTISSEPVRFNEDWGARRVARNNAEIPPAYHLKLNAPDYFPLVRSAVVTPEGNLALEMWTADVDLKRKGLVINKQGEMVTPAFDPVCYQRLLFVHEGTAYFNQVDDGQSYIVMCPFDALESVMKKYSSTYEAQLFITIAN